MDDGTKQARMADDARGARIVDELHRDQIPAEWNLATEQLPCILARSGDQKPFVLLTRDEIAACSGSIDALDRQIRAALDRTTERAA